MSKFTLYGLSKVLRDDPIVRAFDRAVVDAGRQFGQNQRTEIRDKGRDPGSGEHMYDSSLKYEMASFMQVRKGDYLVIRSEGWGTEMLPNAWLTSAVDLLMKKRPSASRNSVFIGAVNLLRYSYWRWRLREMGRCNRSYCEKDFKEAIDDLNEARRLLERSLRILRRQINAKTPQKRRAVAA